MSELPPASRPHGIWGHAVLAAAAFAVDPTGTGGVVLRAMPGPARTLWLDLLRELLPASAPLRRIPLHVTDGRLLGGLDLTATLRAGRPVAERGILGEADGGVVMLSMSERLEPSTAARVAATLDAGEVLLERDGLTLRTPARIGVVALDEGIGDDERPPPALLDRLGFLVDLEGIRVQDAFEVGPSPQEIGQARRLLPAVSADDQVVEALCAAGLALGVASLRSPLLALRAACALAALDNRDQVSREDAASAARLVLAPRATVLPAANEETDEQHATPPSEGAPKPEDDAARRSPDADRPLEDLVLEAAQAAIPANLLAQLQLAERLRGKTRAGGGAGAQGQATRRGRPVGVRRGELRAGARLNVVETLRAAAPWQPMRQAHWASRFEPRCPPRVQVRSDDFRLTRFKHRTETTTIFVVDASGSAALHRLAEAKGAVELLLADCYVRRDQVALIAFRGTSAELLLPPTRSLVRAKRSLAGLPGGGGTPLAAGIEAGVLLAEALRRRQQTPVLILLTDARANVSRGGAPDRTQAEADALGAARQVRAGGLTALLLDTSPRPQPRAQRLAHEMGATYLPLPFAEAAGISQAVQAVATSSRR